MDAEREADAVFIGTVLVGSLFLGFGGLTAIPAYFALKWATGRGSGPMPTGPDGKPSAIGCAHCGTPVSVGHPICSRCGRKWMGR